MTRLHTWAFRGRAAAALLQALIVCAIVLAAVTAVTLAQAQGTSRLHGTVTDQTGGVVPGAVVTVIIGSGGTQTATTNEKGQYAFERLPAGPYTVTVACDGFQVFTSQIELKADSSKSVDARLRVAMAVSTSVQANEGALGLSADPRNSLSAVVLTARDIARLPDDPQRMLMRLLELAGSTGRPEDVSLLVDGFREYKRLPPKDTIEMIRINSNPFSAEFSQPGLDRIEIVTKPGSDTYHGEIRVQGGDSALNARNPIATTKPQMRTRNVNGWLQGPLVKGRVDFMAYAGQWQQDEQAVVNATIFDPSVSASQQPFTTAVSVPARINSFQFGSNIRPIDNHRINFTFTRNEETRRNQGLEGGFDLPERAFDRTQTDEVGRMLWTAVGSHAVNDVRVEVTRNRAGTDPRLQAPAVLVFDAFFAGGNQSAGTRSSTITTQSSNTLTLQRGRHTVKGGVLFETVNQDSTDRTGFNGQFLFGTDMERDANGNGIVNESGLTTPISPIENYRRTVLGRPGYGPSEYRITRGNPDVGVDQWSAGWFALDDWAVSNRFSLSYGVRQDFQNNISQRFLMQPRAALSWLVDANGKNAIKLGGGVFAGRVEPAITLDTRKVNGIDRQQLIFVRPSGFPVAPSSLDQGTLAQSAVYAKADDLRMPYAVIGTISYERQLPAGLFAVAQYTYTKGEHLLRLRNINAPVLGGAGTTGATGTAQGAPILQFESTGRSLQRQAMIGLRGHIKKELTFYGNYKWGKKESDTDGPYTTPANSYDLALDYGYAADDIRHQFVAGATVEFPIKLYITPSLSIASGRPFNITTGADNNADTLFSDRPAFAAPGETGILTAYGLLDPNPAAGDLIIPRNFGRERRQITVNLNVSQTFFKNIILSIDADNLFNNRRLIRSNGVLSSPLFGVPNLALDGRRLLFSLRYGF
jgi:Carboxypeptidase regulatory-like domain